MSRAAQRQGVSPWVITRRSDAEAYPWPNTIFLDYPLWPKNRLAFRWMCLERRLTGWGHLKQKPYAQKVADAIRSAGLAGLPLFLQNDIELAVFLRQQFPNAFIVHHAQNNNTCDWRFRRKFASAVNLATAVSDFCANWNQEYFNVKVHTLYSGVDTERFSPPPTTPAGPPVINFVGRTDPPKAPDLLLRAALKLAARTKAFQLQILGSNYYGHFAMDDFQRQLTALTQELERLGIVVRRPGWIQRGNLPQELRRAHIHVIPARWDEPFGLTTLEGMSCGLATVASRSGGTPEVVGNAALLFNREDVDGLAEHLASLVLDPARLAEYGQKARARALELTWDRTWTDLRGHLGLAESRAA